VTERIKLMTSIAIAPKRATAPLFAKQAATVHKISGGRLKLGIAAGGRENDYEAAGVDYESRNKRFEEMIHEIKEVWANSGNASGDPSSTAIGPDVSSDPPQLILGGSSPVTFRRVAENADGWVAGGAPPDQLAEMKAGVEAAWQEAGRDGKPYIGALAYFALGDTGADDAQSYLGDYYTWLGPDAVNMIVGSAAKDADTVKAYVQGFADAGCDELIFFPSSSDPEQVALLAEAAL
jgi:alkanesulfonate monooxygenase SsuD/methylene tetrahydromethanopterin reductase-like flavin-dependent oxidoreductase (luciferase family)